MIEGTLKYLGKRKSYIISIAGHFFTGALSLRHPLESYVHLEDRSKVDVSFFGGKVLEIFPLETKYYFALANKRRLSLEGKTINPVYTFTKVHNFIIDGQVDTVGSINPPHFDGHKIQIDNFTITKHRHMWFTKALFWYPEIYPNEYVVGG